MVYKQNINYIHSKKGVQLRLFAGTIFTNTDSYGQANFFSVSGNNDYTYDKAFFNRRDVNSQQFHELDGGFKSNTNTTTTKNLLSLNIKAPLKTKLPIGVFADAALATDKFKSGFGNAYADFGVYLPIVTDVFEVYFPVLNSEGLNNTNKYSDQIRFIIDFQAIQPLGMLRKLQIM